jgi:hypothetical protein
LRCIETVPESDVLWFHITVFKPGPSKNNPKPDYAGWDLEVLLECGIVHPPIEDADYGPIISNSDSETVVADNTPAAISMW